MRSASRALAPSHPLHVMPSRITRNSHRPRASDRTMVASEATSSLAAFLRHDGTLSRAEKLTRMDNKPNLSREVKLPWAGPREIISTPVEAEFLQQLLQSSPSLAHWFPNDCTTCFGGDNAINAIQRNATTVKGSSSERNCFNCEA